MLNRRTLVFLAGLVVVTGCRSDRNACRPGGDRGVVACYAGSPITGAELEPHLRPPQPIPGRAALTDPAAEALEAALRVRVLADEARRRGLPITGDSAVRRRASAYQAMRKALAEDHDATADDVSDDEARRYYEDHPGLFNKISGLYARIIVVDDPARAEALYAELSAADEDAFAAAARTESRHPSAADGGDIGETHEPEIDPVLRRLSNGLRRVGAVGGPVALADGGWVIMYASRLEMATKPFEEVRAQVANHIAHERQEAAVAELYARLRDRAPVEVFADELGRYREAAVTSDSE